jgi:hypothetical protein
MEFCLDAVAKLAKEVSFSLYATMTGGERVNFT